MVFNCLNLTLGVEVVLEVSVYRFQHVMVPPTTSSLPLKPYAHYVCSSLDFPWDLYYFIIEYGSGSLLVL